jgi:hypothetical protein
MVDQIDCTIKDTPRTESSRVRFRSIPPTAFERIAALYRRDLLLSRGPPNFSCSLTVIPNNQPTVGGWRTREKRREVVVPQLRRR